MFFSISIKQNIYKTKSPLRRTFCFCPLIGFAKPISRLYRLPFNNGDFVQVARNRLLVVPTVQNSQSDKLNINSHKKEYLISQKQKRPENRGVIFMIAFEDYSSVSSLGASNVRLIESETLLASRSTSLSLTLTS